MSSALFALGGCSEIGPSICARPETEEPRPYNEGSVEGDTYRTSDWTGPLLSYPGGAYYDLFHGLDAVPDGMAFYLSFSEGGVDAASLAPAAGNQVEVKAIDDEKITVLNGTCAEYYLLAIAWLGEP